MKDDTYLLARGHDTWTPDRLRRSAPPRPISTYFIEVRKSEQEKQRQLEEENRVMAEQIAHLRAMLVTVLYMATDDVPEKRRASAAILKEVADKHGLTVLDLKRQGRQKPAVVARQEAYYRLRTETPLSYPQIGRILGHRDHTTILHGVRRHAAKHGLPVPGEGEPKNDQGARL